MKRMVCASVLLALTGCGGGGNGSEFDGATVYTSDSESSANRTGPDGIWTGTEYDVQTGASYEVVALASASGEFRIIGLGRAAQQIGNLTHNNQALGGGVTYFYSNPYGDVNSSTASSNATLSGSFTAQKTLNLNVEFPSGAISRLALAYDSRYDTPASLTTVAGTYSNDSLSLTFNGTELYGQDTQGCVYAGKVSIPQAQHNLYKLTVELSNCAGLNGNYTGMATLRQISPTTNQLIYQLNNGYSAINGNLAE
ncbi:MAG TPA: hypothetical protein VFM46_07490 [Pseudomonadales bacterium]|nr:hypothetical protein [Pseudomonadales bacterium]